MPSLWHRSCGISTGMPIKQRCQEGIDTSKCVREKKKLIWLKQKIHTGNTHMLAKQKRAEHSNITSSIAVRVDIMEWEEVLMAFFLMPNLPQKRKASTPLIIFNPNLNQTFQYYARGWSKEIGSFSFGFPTLSNSQTYFTTELLSIIRQRVKRLWNQLGKQVAWSVRKCYGKTRMITTGLLHNQVPHLLHSVCFAVLFRDVILFKRKFFSMTTESFLLTMLIHLVLISHFQTIHVILSQNNGTSRQLWQ